MESRFTALRVIGVVFKILAWLALILGLLGAIGALFAGFTLSNQSGLFGFSFGGPLAGIASFIVVLITAIVNFMLFYAVGESVYLFLSIEENTRRTAYFLQQQYTPRQSSYPAAPLPASYEE